MSQKRELPDLEAAIERADMRRLALREQLAERRAHLPLRYWRQQAHFTTPATEETARKGGLKKLFALTTHTPHWFLEHGFKPARIEDLPMQKQRIYNYHRNSVVLVKDV